MKKNLLKLKRELLCYMNEAINLFEIDRYGHIDGYVCWFKDKVKILENADVNSAEFKKVLKEIDNSFGGMESFTGVSIYPKENSGISEIDARKKQFELVEKIGNTIDKILKELRAEKRKSKKKK